MSKIGKHNHVLTQFEAWPDIYCCELCDKLFIESNAQSMAYTNAVGKYTTTTYYDDWAEVLG